MYYFRIHLFFIFAAKIINNMDNCLYVSKDCPFDIPDGYSFCIYYIVFCLDSCCKCPFDFLPHHLVRVHEFSCYPVLCLKDSRKNVSSTCVQLSLFEDYA